MAYEKKLYNQKEKIKAFKFLMNRFDISIAEAQKWIAKGRVIYNSKEVSRASEIIKGDIEVLIYSPITKNLSPIFQTVDFAIFDKPSGVLSHSTNRNTPYSLTDEVKYQFGKDANIIHRLDKETSGLILCAKNKTSERYLKLLFQEKKVTKSYLAIVRGKIKKELFIDAPIKKNGFIDGSKIKVTIDKRGKPAQTIITPIEYNYLNNTTLIKAIPLTGRQHQIRVHLFHVKHSIIGDPIYGMENDFIDKYLKGLLTIKERIKESRAKRLMLHANYLEFVFGNRFKIHSKELFTLPTLF